MQASLDDQAMEWNICNDRISSIESKMPELRALEVKINDLVGRSEVMEDCLSRVTSRQGDLHTNLTILDRQLQAGVEARDTIIETVENQRKQVHELREHSDTS